MAFDIQGLLGNPALMDIGTGLLANSGYSTTPTTFGQALGGAMQYANQRDAQRLQMDALRTQMVQAKAKTDAMEQLQKLTQPGTTPGPIMMPTPAPITTPEGRNKAMGLLSVIAPEQVASGLLATMNPQQDSARLPTEMNAFVAMRPDLQMGTPEFYQEYQRFTTQQQIDPTQQQLNQIELQNAQIEAANLVEARNKAQTDAFANKRKMALNVNNSLEKLSNMVENVKKLEGTWLETGLPLGDLRRGAAGIVAGIQSLAGKDKTKADALKTAWDQLNKDLSDFTLDTASGFSNGALTDSKLLLMQQGFASAKTSPAANLHIFGETIRNIQDAAEIDGIPVRNPDKYRALSDVLLKKNDTTLPPASDIPGVIQSATSPQEINALEQELNRLDTLIKQLGG